MTEQEHKLLFGDAIEQAARRIREARIEGEENYEFQR